jgi:hypothetical protein
MAHVRAPHRVVPGVPVRPGILLHRGFVRPPINHRRPVPLKPLPVLQAPTYLLPSDSIFEANEEQSQRETTIISSTVVKENHGKKSTNLITARPPTFILQHNYPRQPLPPITTRPVRRAEPKYGEHFYNSR